MMLILTFKIDWWKWDLRVQTAKENSEHGIWAEPPTFGLTVKAPGEEKKNGDILKGWGLLEGVLEEERP